MDRMKVIILGDSGVGKSSLVYTYVSGEFREEIEPTKAASFMSKQVKIDGRYVRLDLWDTAGQEKNAILGRLYWREAKVVLLTYDISKESSIEKMIKWHDVVSSELETSTIKIFIAACKIDLFEGNYEVPSQVTDFSIKVHAPVFKISAKANCNLERLFNCIAKVALDPASQSSSHSSITLNKQRHSERFDQSIAKTQKSKCCS